MAATAPERQETALRSAFGDHSWTAASLIADLRAAGPAPEPFDEDDLAFCGDLSDALMALREVPDAVALGYWLRPAALTRARTDMEQRRPHGTISVPRGLAFHVTPANVDTLFAYSWLLSMLAGNCNVVRVSSRGGVVQQRILGVIGQLLALDAHAKVAQRNRIVTSGRDDDVTRRLSAACDLRVVWGGDATIEHIRAFPMATHAREVVFADRHSMALLDADAVSKLSTRGLARLADHFFVDAFNYDQGACSSPRLVVWRASTQGAEATEQARIRFHEAVEAAVRQRRYEAQTGAAINKKVMAYERAALADGVVIDERSNEVTWVTLPDTSGYDRANCGGGLFFEVTSDDIFGDLGALVDRRDQTASCFGFSDTELRALARALGGRGIDRFVAMGRALQFGVLWDGLDLLDEFSRRVVIDVG